MQGTWVQSLAQEDPMWWGGGQLSLRTLIPVLHNNRGYCNDKPAHLNEE